MGRLGPHAVPPPRTRQGVLKKKVYKKTGCRPANITQLGNFLIYDVCNPPPPKQNFKNVHSQYTTYRDSHKHTE